MPQDWPEKACAECKKREQEQRQERIEKRKEQGLCIMCGKRKPIKGGLRCAECLSADADRAWRRRTYEKK